MRSFSKPLTVVVTTVALGSAAAPPASASSAVSPPWVTASSTSSLTLDWPSKSGVGSYRVFWATSYGGVLKSSARSKVAGSSRLKVTGLRAGQMYCFQVARKSGANRSQRYCHPTMARANRSSATKVSVATFNLCAVASGCHGWSGREDAIVSRIRTADADVLTIQEASGRTGTMRRLLKPLGYAQGAASTTEAVYYRTARLSPVTTTRTECDEQEIVHVGDTTGWDTQQGVHDDGTHEWSWDEESQTWRRWGEVCAPVEVPDAGSFDLQNRATAAWARLTVKASGTAYVFVSAHLSSGKSSGDDKRRDAETRRLISKAEDAAGGPRVVYAGDFNSNRSRADDTPRKRFARSGVTDAYDRSSTYSRAYLNSYNGWKTKPNKGVRYGDHVDHVFVRAGYGVSDWRVVAKMDGGRYATPIPSDHNLVRATIWLS